MSEHRKSGDDYLSRYPWLNKWVRACVCCGARGYDPAIPETLTRSFGGGELRTTAAANIRSFFPPLELDEHGLCETCQKLLNKKQP